MGKVYEKIDQRIAGWIGRQQMFFVASAPLAADGAVNLSPKGLDTLRVIDEHTLAYLDFGGSGIETVAHLRENGRIVIMMCSFAGPPKIFRFHGRGVSVFPDDDQFDELAACFNLREVGVRSIIRVAVTRIADSCGYGVPLYAFEGQRKTSPKYVRERGVETIRAYLKEKNRESIDGLTGLTDAEASAFRGPVDDTSS